MLLIRKNARYRKAVARLKSFPRLIDDIARTGTREIAEEVRDTIVTGIQKGNLVSPRLSPGTFAIRKALGGTRGTSKPLLGKGGMIAGLKVRKIGPRTHRVAPEGTHRSGISQRKLWGIHENGALVPRTGTMIAFFRYAGINLRPGFTKIPARRPFKKGINRWIKGQQKKAKTKKLAKQIARKLIS